jgi:iron complex outermembrane receptor protein
MKKILLVLFALATFTVSAQDTTKIEILSDVVVTGVRTDSKTPITQKTITKDDIAKSYQGQEMSYILDKTPAITSQSDGGQPNGYTSFRLRGIDQTRVNMTLNGVPLNEPEDQGVYFSNYPNFAVNLKSMQVQRGVGTSANGTAAYAGSINFESKTGVDKETTAQIGYGSFNTQRANVTYGSGINKHGLAFYTGLSGYQSDGYKYNSSGKGYSAFLSGGYYSEKNVIKFTGFSGRSLNQMAWFAVLDSTIEQDPRTNYNPKGENDDFTQSLAQLQYVRSINKYSTLTTTAYYNRLDGVWGMFLYDSIGNPSDLLNFKLGSNFYGIMTNYHVEYNKLNLNVGAHANSYNRTHNGSISDLSLYTNTGYKTDYSGYIKASYDIGKFSVFGDIQARYVTFTYKGDTSMTPLSWFFLNPKGGITYNYSKKVNYYVSVGQNHREPTRTDMFGGNDNLISLNIITPESVIDYELGSNLNFEKFSAQYNVYFMDFKNEITLLGALGSNGLPLMTKVDKSFRSGIEFDAKYKINKSFTLTNSSNYAYCRIQGDGKQYSPLYTPNLIVNQGVEYGVKGFLVGISGRYQSSSYINFDNTGSIPAFTTLNATIGYTYKHYSIDIQGVNLTNVRYYTSGYMVGNSRYLYVNAPASCYVTIKAAF